jgi:hypothetical protein
MISVARNNFEPFAQEIPATFRIIHPESAAWRFCPCQVTQFVSPVMKPLIKNFLVKAGPVESGIHRELNIIF